MLVIFLSKNIFYYKIFFLFFGISAIFIFLGLLLILRTNSKNLWRDIIKLNLDSFDFNLWQCKLGLLFLAFAWLAPFFAISLSVILPIYWYIIIFGIAFLGLYIFTKIKIVRPKKLQLNSDYLIIKKTSIQDEKLLIELWTLYSSAFGKVNLEVPCQQSIKDKDEFLLEMKKDSVIKYLVYFNNQLIGLGIITNDLANCTWISEEYFAKHYSTQHQNKNLFYFMGIALIKKYRRNGLALKLLKYIFDDLPEGFAIGFDHSYGMNKFVSYFSSLISTGEKSLKKDYLDRQVYYIVTPK